MAREPEVAYLLDPEIAAGAELAGFLRGKFAEAGVTWTEADTAAILHVFEHVADLALETATDAILHPIDTDDGAQLAVVTELRRDEPR